jgi:hypothetical protein
MKTIGMFLIALAFMAISCKDEENVIDKDRWPDLQALYAHNEAKITITQGIAGTLIMKEGNCMPIIGENSTCKSYPVKRRISVYAYTTTGNVTGTLPAYDAVNTTLIAEADADAEGFFQVSLAPGKYSVFIREKGKFYARSFDGTDGINPAEVENGNVKIANQAVDYASY